MSRACCWQHEASNISDHGQRKGGGITTGRTKRFTWSSWMLRTIRVVVGDVMKRPRTRDEFIVDRCNWIPFDEPPEQIEGTDDAEDSLTTIRTPSGRVYWRWKTAQAR